MTKRTDCHSPSNIIPENYEFVVVRTREDDENGFGGEAVKMFNNHRLRTGGVFSDHNHGGNCHVCGAWMIDYAIFYHQPTNKYIQTGLDCAAKIEHGHEDDFRRMAVLRRAHAKKLAAQTKACDYLDQHGLLNFVETLYTDGNVGGKIINHDQINPWNQFLGIETGDLPQNEIEYLGRQFWIITNMIDSLIKYGWSDKQLDFAKKIVDDLKDVPTTVQKKLEQRSNTPDCPEGKVKVVGTIITIKTVEGFYGHEYKMLVESEEGWKVWVTQPSSIGDSKVGDKCEFSCTLTRSDKDSKFGFGKRPTKAKII